MQTTVRKSSEKKEKTKDQDEKIKKSISTPRNFIQKSTTADIYTQKKPGALQSTKAPKKVSSSSLSGSNVSPMKDLLKSSPSSVSVKSVYDKKPTEANTSQSAKKLNTPRMAKTSLDSARKIDAKTPSSSVKKPAEAKVSSKTAKQDVKLPAKSKELPSSKNTPESVKITKAKELPMNVTVNSPPVKRKEREFYKAGGDSKEVDRQRTKTRTLNESEVKVLNAVDNNAEMLNLSKRLNAQPKAFFINLDGDKPKPINDKTSDEDVSYEDDFESYESDFDSYHSESASASERHSASETEHNEQSSESKEGKDEENMLDSGSFDLRESQRSANKTKPVVMDFILEDTEDMSDKKSSLTDEGFQEMSSSSAVSSMRTVHIDVLDKPLFIDFTKSKQNRRKKRMSEHLKQRAKDLLSMITLHEMSYSLFEMKPIPYDLFMVTFGRSNYTQIAVQTFDDGVSEEIQTEDIVYDCKWTQCPIEFSNHDIYLKSQDISKKYAKNNEDYLTRFSFLLNKNSDVAINNKINTDNDYKLNPLRVYFEQKDGAGSCEMLPYEDYKLKLKNNDFDISKLSKFLKKTESRVSRVLNKNIGNSEASDLVKTSKLPFSKGYVSISTKNLQDEKLLFLKSSKITGLMLSETKTNLIMTVHGKSSSGIAAEKCVICLWDISVARREPVKILVAIDNVSKGRFRGNAEGIFVAALEDGSLHLWDLSEEPTWQDSIASDEKPTNFVEINSERMTQTEIDREWNSKNLHVGHSQPSSQSQCLLQPCAYTSSGSAISGGNCADCVVGLEFAGDATCSRDGMKVVGQICSLQRIGILTIWSIIQDKSKSTTHDMGKAFWSKMRLERTQTISLIDHFDVEKPLENDISTNFNLNAAKRRLSGRKQEKNVFKRQNSRPKSAVSNFECDIDRTTSAASVKNKRVLSVEKNVSQSWENGIVCCDLKIMKWNKLDHYLVAKNYGEVLCFTRNAGAVKISRFCVATDTSSVTCLDVSPHGLPYFLAATNTGTLNLCSMVDARVLLTLDCRNIPQETIDKCHSDHKGRYVSSATQRPAHSYAGETRTGDTLPVCALHWSPGNPCRVHALLGDGAVLLWDLTHSDICARSVCARAALATDYAENTLALLSPEGDVEVHHLTADHRNAHYLDLFHKYVTIL